MLLEKIKKINPISAALHAAGLGTSIASVIGSYNYMLVESANQPMAAAFAVGLAAAIFGGWEFAFNASNKSRRIKAAAIALLAAAVSGQTVFEYNHHIAVVDAQAKADAEAAKTDSKQSEAAAALKSQLEELKASNEALRTQNAADLKSVTELEGSAKKGSEWTAANIRKAIEKRNQQIAANTDKAAQLTAKLDADNKTKTGNNAPVNVPISPMQIIRAYLFEVLTILSLLFAKWLRDEKQSADNQLAQPLLSAIEQAREVLTNLETSASDVEVKVADAITRINAIIDTAIDDLKTAADLAANSSAEQLHAIQDKYTNISTKLQAVATHAISDINLVVEHALTTAGESVQTIDAAKASLDKGLIKLIDASKQANELTQSLSTMDKKIAEGRELSTEIFNLLSLSEQITEQHKNCIYNADAIKNSICEATNTAAAESNNLQKIIFSLTSTMAAANDTMAALEKTRHDTMAGFQEPAMKPAIEPAMVEAGDDKPKISRESIISLLKNRQIALCPIQQKITIKQITAQTGVGKDRATAARQIAIDRGYLTPDYRYPLEGQDNTHPADDLSHVHDSNVVSLWRS